MNGVVTISNFKAFLNNINIENSRSFDFIPNYTGIFQIIETLYQKSFLSL